MTSRDKTRTTTSAVSRPAAADSADALLYFERLLQFETDCWDVHHALSTNRQDFVLLDVRGEALFEGGHIAGAVNLPHSRISADSLSVFDAATLFVVYCAGPHCNGADNNQKLTRSDIKQTKILPSQDFIRTTA